MAGGKDPVKTTTALEYKAAVAGKNHHTDKGQRSAAHRINQISNAGASCDAVHFMHDKRQRTERQQLVEQIEREQICRHCYTEDNAIGHRKEGKESVLRVVVLHIFKGIKVCNRPEDRYNRHKHRAQAINVQRDGKVFTEDADENGISTRCCRQEDCQQRKCCHRNHRAQAHNIDIAAMGIFDRTHHHAQATQEGDKNQKQ